MCNIQANSRILWLDIKESLSGFGNSAILLF